VYYVTHSGPEVLFKTCVAMKFVDDDDDQIAEINEFSAFDEML